MWYKNVGTLSFFRFVTNYAFDSQDRQTADGRTDSFLVTRPQCMPCGKKQKAAALCPD